MNIEPWLKRILTVAVTAIAIALGVLIQLILVVLLCSLLPDEIAVKTILVSPFAIGLESYFVFRWRTKRRETRIEAEQWLTQRSRRTARQRARLYRSKQIGIWIPTFLVTICFLFAPEVFGMATHFLYGRPVVLNGYEVRRPITWMVFDAAFPDYEESQNAVAFGFKGPLRSGFSGFLGLYSRASTMSFSSLPITERFLQDQKAMSSKTLQIAHESMECTEYVHVFPHRAFDQENEAVTCRSASGRFFASFYGDKNAVSEFYETIQNVRQR